MKKPSVVLAIMSAALAVMISTGIRSSFGLFVEPISIALETGREPISLALAMNNLIFGLPLVGLLADRIGPRWVVLAGGILYAFGLLLVTQMTTVGGLLLAIGVLVGLALSATTYVVVLGAVAQLVPPEKRSQSFGIITAAGSSGMFVMPPIAQYLNSNFGWETAFVALAASALLIVVIAFGLPAKPGKSSSTANLNPSIEEPFIKILNRAFQNKSYLMLLSGFFVCGFHVAFIGAHLPAFLTDNGLSGEIAAAALSVVGIFNMVGSYLFGYLGDRYRKKRLLSFLYFGRSVVILIFILLPITSTSALVFAGAMGFLWLATVPLTSGSIATIFGVRYLSTLYGFVFLSHQVGAFLGVWLGGRIFDAYETYNPVWYMAIALGIFAAFVHVPINEQPIAQPTTA